MARDKVFSKLDSLTDPKHTPIHALYYDRCMDLSGNIEDIPCAGRSALQSNTKSVKHAPLLISLIDIQPAVASFYLVAMVRLPKKS